MNRLARTFKTVAVILSPLLAGCGTIPKPKQEPFQLFASDETRKTFTDDSWALLSQNIPAWAQHDILLIAPCDTITNEGSLQIYNTGATANLISQHQTISPPNPSLGIGFLIGIVDSAMKDGVCFHYPDSSSRGIIVTIPKNLDRVEKIFPRTISGLPDSLLGNIPGTARDWLLMIMAHESVHAKNVAALAKSEEVFLAGGAPLPMRHRLIVLPNEADADIEGMTHYFGAAAHNKSINTDVPAAMEALRAIGALRQSGNALIGTNGYNLFKDMAWASPLGVAFSDHATNALYDVDTASRTVTVNSVIKTDEIARAILRINTQAHLLLALAEGPRHPDIVKKSENMQVLFFNELGRKKEADNPYVPDTESLIGKAPYETLNKLSADAEGRGIVTTMAKGSILAIENPLLHYAAVKFLYERGMVSATPTENLIAREYIAAFEKYVPACKTDPAAADFQARLAQGGDDLCAQMAAIPGRAYLDAALDAVGRHIAEALLLPAGSAQAGPRPTQSFLMY